ncbi:hypothetical protein BJ875DRAFT_391265, partial [Amylocarpus encephaloides]
MNMTVPLIDIARFILTWKLVSYVGPVIVQCIINSTKNNYSAFQFLCSMDVVATIGMILINVEKGRENCRRFVQERKSIRESSANRS